MLSACQYPITIHLPAKSFPVRDCFLPGYSLSLCPRQPHIHQSQESERQQRTEDVYPHVQHLVTHVQMCGGFIKPIHAIPVLVVHRSVDVEFVEIAKRSRESTSRSRYHEQQQNSGQCFPLSPQEDVERPCRSQHKRH